MRYNWNKTRLSITFHIVNLNVHSKCMQKVSEIIWMKFIKSRKQQVGEKKDGERDNEQLFYWLRARTKTSLNRAWNGCTSSRPLPPVGNEWRYKCFFKTTVLIPTVNIYEYWKKINIPVFCPTRLSSLIHPQFFLHQQISLRQCFQQL